MQLNFVVQAHVVLRTKTNLMNAVILTIGDELLYGQTIDTNSAYMGRQLADIGLRVYEKFSVSDNAEHIVQALNHAKSVADVVLITGGLGPTKDDLTKHTLARYFHTDLVMNQEILDLLEGFFAKRGIAMLPAHRDQALMPASCTPLRNNRGTAWGMWFEQNGKIFASMPGVPHEMKGLMEEQVLPRLKQHFVLPVILHKHINTAGIGESYIADKIEAIEDALPSNMKLAYLPDTGMVRLRLTARGTDASVLQPQLDAATAKITEQIEKHIYGFDGTTLEQALGNLLRQKKATISTAESCTGGTIASRIISASGSSDYYMGSVVAYANDVKTNLLGVDSALFEKHGAVSEEVVRAMVIGACKNLGTDYAIATTGIAGPTGGTPEKPVGTIWTAVGNEAHMVVKMHSLPFDRERNILMTSILALEMMRKYLAGY